MKEKKYYIALDDFELRVVVNCMNEMRNKLIADGKYTDALDEVLLCPKSVLILYSETFFFVLRTEMRSLINRKSIVYTSLYIIVIAAMLAALTCVATMIIKIPSPLKGCLNMGDCVILLAGWMLNPVYGFLAAGLGSALTDLFSGYVVYAPATFVIKGLMALVTFYGFKLLHNKIGNLPSRIITGVLAEVVMILGYFLFEGVLYGFGLLL